MANTIVVNGRRIPVPDSVRGSEIIKNTQQTPGRRTVLRNGIDAETVEPNRVYRKEELIDKKGNPVKFDTIPERTKGGDPGASVTSGEKIMFFLDYANINRSARNKSIDIDYAHLISYITGGRFLVDAFAYFPVDPRTEHATDFEKEKLWLKGYLVNEKIGTIAGDSYKCNFDVEIVMDILKAVYQAKPDVIVLASGDSDFIPLVTELRKMGVRTEVAAFPESASKDIVLKCSGFINLDRYFDDYLAFVEETMNNDDDPGLEEDDEENDQVESDQKDEKDAQ